MESKSNNSELTQWKPKQSGNTKGRPKYELNEHLENLPKISNSYIEKLISKYCNVTLEIAQNAVVDNSLSLIERLIARSVVDAFVLGDHRKTDFILNRIIGKVAEKEEEKKLPEPTVVKLVGEDAVLVLGHYSSVDK